MITLTPNVPHGRPPPGLIKGDKSRKALPQHSGPFAWGRSGTQRGISQPLEIDPKTSCGFKCVYKQYHGCTCNIQVDYSYTQVKETSKNFFMVFYCCIPYYHNLRATYNICQPEPTYHEKSQTSQISKINPVEAIFKLQMKYNTLQLFPILISSFVLKLKDNNLQLFPNERQYFKAINVTSSFSLSISLNK